MAFLDNSGDIILDAVLTDAGRRRLAKGDGSFRIAKYAFGDDEINYGSYNSTHASGSAYYDLEILQTPALEAFTNNIASLKSKLISLTNNNLLYLPTIKLNDTVEKFKTSANSNIASGSFAILVDVDSVNTFGQSGVANVTNYIDGFSGPGGNAGGGSIRLDQGLDTNEISNAFNLDPELTENQYIVEIDNRFGTIVDRAGTAVNPSFIDDDNIASYYLSTAPFVTNLPAETVGGTTTNSVINGPRGTKLEFSILSSVSLRTSGFLFDQVGSTSTFQAGDDGTTVQTFKFIDSIIRVQGATTGYRVDVPVRFIKKT